MSVRAVNWNRRAEVDDRVCRAVHRLTDAAGGRPPTLREIATETSLSHIVVRQSVSRLVSSGVMIRGERCKARTLRVPVVARRPATGKVYRLVPLPPAE